MPAFGRPSPSRPPARRVSALLHRLREGILKEWRSELDQLQGSLGAELRRYRMEYEADFRGAWRADTPSALLSAVARADIVFSGDHHTLAAAQRLPIRLLRRLEPTDRPVTLALEMLHSRDQAAVDAFLGGRLSAAALRVAIGFDARWGFDWLAYLPLLEYARRHGHPVLAINTEAGPARGRLARRDRHAAERLVQRLRERPDERIFVLAGDWHVARAHLPRRVERLARRSGRVLRTVIVHQNHETLYRRFVRAGAAPPTVARQGRRTFCVFNATPLTKVSAQLHGSSRQALRSLYGEDSATDTAAAFHDVVTAMARHLSLPTPLDSLTIWQIDDGEDALVALELNGVRSLATRRRLERGEPVFLAGRRALLLPPASLNRLGEEAARQLATRWRGWHPRNPHDAFYGAALQAGAVFLATRLLNPNRKCALLADLATGATDTRPESHLAAWARCLMNPRSHGRLADTHAFWRAHRSTQRRVARRIGAAWGYHVYDAYEEHRLDLNFIRSLFETDCDQASCPNLFHSGWRGWRRHRRADSKQDLL